MSEGLEFSQTYNYDTLKTGISLPVILQSGEMQVEIHAKLDTGSTHCIFEREHGELLAVGTPIEETDFFFVIVQP